MYFGSSNSLAIVVSFINLLNVYKDTVQPSFQYPIWSVIFK